jgi:hypothetical protein
MAKPVKYHGVYFEEIMTLKPYQITAVRRQVHAALKEAGIAQGCGSSYKSPALKAIVGLKPQLSGPEFDYARNVVTEWLG